jgi:hypothetical protein
VPTIAVRFAQTVVARRLEPKVDAIFHPDSYGYRPRRSALDAVPACRERPGSLGKTTHIGAGWADNDDSAFRCDRLEFAPARVAGTQRLARPLMTAASRWPPL